MKILALNPPFHPRYSREQRSPAVTKSGTLYYPMWLAYAVGLLEKHGYPIMFIDAAARCIGMEKVLARCRSFQPDVVLLDTSTPSIHNDAAVASDLKTNFPDAFIAMVGVHVSALPQKTLEEAPAVDAVAVGEYEHTVLEMVRALENREGLETVKGLAHKSGDRVLVNPRREYLQDLDSLPFVSSVYKKHLDHTRYFYSHSKHPIVTIITGRGCPFRCTYCVYPQVMHGRKYRPRAVEKVAEEFAYIHENFPDVREIMIEDDTLTLNRGRSRALARALIDRGLNRVPWSANSRADLDYETMALLKRAGCRLFCVGYESGNQEILNNIRKGTSLDRIRAFARDARRAGIMVHGCFMVGNRGETRATLEQTLRFALELEPDTVQFFPIMVYPGTEDYDWNREKGHLVSEDFSTWVTPAGLHNSVVSNPDLTYETLVDFCDAARRKYYLRPKYILRKLLQSIRDPWEAKRNLKAFHRFFRHLFVKSANRRACES
jgi:radical SAM superfamily enzyme YgiQ (UPF0313 family)